MDTVQGEITLERLVAKVAELEQEHAELRRENARIGEELATLSKEGERRASIGQPTIRPLLSERPQDPRHHISRRGVLRTALTLAAVGAAGLVSGERADTQVAAAATADTNFVANGGSGIAIGFNAPTSASFTVGVYGYGIYAGVSGEADQSFGVVGKSNTGAGVAGISSGSNANGVIGTNTNYTGVVGKTGSNSSSAAGVYGEGPFVGVAGQVSGASGAPTTPVAIYGTGRGVNVNNYPGGAVGVQGDSDINVGVFGQSTSAHGVFGQSTDGHGVLGVSVNQVGVYGQNKQGYGVYCYGNFAATGTKSAIVSHPDGLYRKLYCLESPECWFEDFGAARLVDGTVTVQLDPEFTAVVRNDAYHIFLTPQGDSNGLYVSSQSPTSFTVKEQHAGTSTLRFSYRVVAMRKDVVAPRLERVTLEEVPKLPDLPANEKYSKTSNRDAG